MKPDTINRFVQELKRRRVIRGIVVYGASTLVLFEAATNLAPYFGREHPPTWFVVLLGVGFFVSLWFSWIYDITPGGIKKTDPVSENKVPIPKKEVKTYQTITFISVMIIVGLLTYNIIDNAKLKMVRALDKSIAVLPLDDNTLSPTKAREYEFIGRQITFCLKKVKDYRIVPWDDCRNYQRQNKNRFQIANDLNVSLLIEWKPYVTEEDQHLSIELISVDNSSLVWGRSFEINGNWPDEISRLSRKISKRIVRELRTYLTPQERALIDEQRSTATANFAFAMGDSYTQDAWNQAITGKPDSGKKDDFTDSISFDLAIKYYSEAIAEDPSFAEAYAKRAKARLMGIRAGFFDSSVMNDSWEDIEKAFELNPELPEVHIAMGFYYYYGKEQYSLAAVSFQKANELGPQNNEYQYYLMKIYVELGNWREVQVLSDRVQKSNPQSALVYTNLGLAYAYLHDLSAALLCQNRAIDLLPQWYAPYVNKAYTQCFSGNIRDARESVIEAIENTGKSFHRFHAELDMYEGNYVSAAQHIELSNEAEFKDLQESKGDAFLIKAKIHKHAGHLDQAKEYYNMAAVDFQDRITANPEDYLAYSKLGLAYAGMGKGKLALENGHKALEFGMQNYSGYFYPSILYNMALTYTITGDHESALNSIKELLESHSLYTSDFIKFDPDLKPLLDDPGF